MSLRDTNEQIAYENWTFDLADACEAEGLKCPTDFATRWNLGQSVDEIMCELRLTPTARKYAA